MKQQLVIFAFLIACISLQLSCRKEQRGASASAIVNGEIWEADQVTSVWYIDSSGVWIDLQKSHGKGGYYFESISFSKFLPTVGLKQATSEQLSKIYQDSCRTFFATTIEHNEVLFDLYYLKGIDTENFMVVDSYDSLSGRMIGRFQGTYYMKGGDINHPENWLPEVLEIKAGHFDVIVK
jgi:hypothetical protein